MSSSASYAKLAEQLRQASLPYAPAELHGLLCGLLALTPAPSDAQLLAHLAEHVGETAWPPSLRAAWKQLAAEVLAGYQSEEMALVLLLPDAALAERAVALAHWCEGFLAGFAEQAGSNLPDIVQEALRDLVAINQMPEVDQDGEEERKLLTLVEEHCRMLALTIFTEMALAADHKKGLH